MVMEDLKVASKIRKHQIRQTVGRKATKAPHNKISHLAHKATRDLSIG